MKRNLWLVMLLVAMMALWGCSDDDDDDGGTEPPVPTVFETLTKAMDDYVNSADCPGVVPATTVYDNLESKGADYYWVIDIRGAEDFENMGHIANVDNIINVGLGGLEAAVADWPLDRRILVVCYSGQSAGIAKIALELKGFTEVYSLKFGMSGWHAELDGPWEGNHTDIAGLEPELTNNNAAWDEATWEDYDYPTPPTNVTTVAEAVTWLLTTDGEGFGGNAITYTGYAAEDPADWYVLNYHPASVYLGQDTASGVPGHIPGAFQFTPRETLGWDQLLGKIPPNKKILIYCWTGQTSAQIAGYLNMLGYDAYSMKWGVNGLFYEDLDPTHGAVWSSTTLEYPLTEPPVK